MNKSKVSIGTSPPAPAKPAPDIEKALLQIEELKKQLDARQQEMDKREKELDSRAISMKGADAEVKRQVEQLHKTKAEKMKENLHSQPKVTIMIPLDPGEAEGATLPVTLNGYKYTIMKNVYVEVPKQIADVVMNSLKQTVAAGVAFRTDIARPSKGGITVEQALL